MEAEAFTGNASFVKTQKSGEIELERTFVPLPAQSCYRKDTFGVN